MSDFNGNDNYTDNNNMGNPFDDFNNEINDSDFENDKTNKDNEVSNDNFTNSSADYLSNGVIPSFSTVDDNFSLDTSSQPTRVMKPISTTSTDGPTSTYVRKPRTSRNRRAGRVNYNTQQDNNESTLSYNESNQHNNADEIFDPFAAGDSETQESVQPSYMQEEPKNYPTNNKFTGARTSYPKEKSASPYQRKTPVTDNPFAATDNDSSMQEPSYSRRVQPPTYQRTASQQTQTNYDRTSQRNDFSPTPIAKRPAVSSASRYVDEDENYNEANEKKRGGKVFAVIIIILLLIGALLAGILLPNWDSMDNSVGNFMSPIKTTLQDGIDSIKNLISPNKTEALSFSVTPTSATAPVELIFTIQASTSAQGISIVDESGMPLLQKTLADVGTTDCEIRENTGYNIWIIRYSISSQYESTVHPQVMDEKGLWIDFPEFAQPISIDQPVQSQPAIQSFNMVSTDNTTVPTTLNFAVTTSSDVLALQIVDENSNIVAESSVNNATSEVQTTSDSRAWTLSADFTTAYSGTLTLLYQTAVDISYVDSGYTTDVTVIDEAVQTPEVTSAPTVAATATSEPTATPSPTPTIEPTPSPTPTPAFTPEPTALPILSGEVVESALPSTIDLSYKAYEGTTSQSSYSRSEKIIVNDPFNYVAWDESGVLTFRSGPFRQNSAFGTVEVQSASLTKLWEVAVTGSTETSSSSLTGVAWPGQALIVKWPVELRKLIGIDEAYVDETALKEVIVGAQNGYLYFLNLLNGAQTREPVELGYPSNGALSLETNGAPLLTIGQHFSVLKSKRIDNGLHLFNLVTNEQITLLDGRDELMQTNYSGFNGAPLFDKNSGSLTINATQSGNMITAGENGLLYVMDPGGEFDYTIGNVKLNISPTYQRYSWKASGQDSKETNVDGSVAMYSSYVYYGDEAGILQCVDINTLSPVWAVDTGDNIDATVALDMENDTTVALYTGNTIENNRKGVCNISRYNALTGELDWTFEVPDVSYSADYKNGCYASPVVGDNAVDDLVFFTVANGSSSSILYALDKTSGAVRWSAALQSSTVSSPVAIYNEDGDAWIVQAQGNGALDLFNAQTGELLNTLQLDGKIEASPSVYKDILVISTTGSSTGSYIYGIKIN